MRLVVLPEKTMSMLKVWSEDECLYLDYENEDEFFLVKKCFKFEIIEKKSIIKSVLLSW